MQVKRRNRAQLAPAGFAHVLRPCLGHLDINWARMKPTPLADPVFTNPWLAFGTPPVVALVLPFARCHPPRAELTLRNKPPPANILSVLLHTPTKIICTFCDRTKERICSRGHRTCARDRRTSARLRGGRPPVPPCLHPCPRIHGDIQGRNAAARRTRESHTN